MNKYELVLLMPGKATLAKKKSLTEKVNKIISSLKGKTGKVDDWGKIDLRYNIEGNDDGIFLLFNIELGPENVNKLSTKLMMEDEILRHMIVKA